MVTVRCDGDDDLAGDLGAHVVVAESDVGGVSVSEGGGGNSMVSGGNGVVGVVGHDGLGGVGHGVGVGHRGGNRVDSVGVGDRGGNRVVHSVGVSGRGNSSRVGKGVDGGNRVDKSVGVDGGSDVLGISLGLTLHDMLDTVVLGNILGSGDTVADSGVVVGALVAGDGLVGHGHSSVGRDRGGNMVVAGHHRGGDLGGYIGGNRGGMAVGSDRGNLAVGSDRGDLAVGSDRGGNSMAISGDGGIDIGRDRGGDSVAVGGQRGGHMAVGSADRGNTSGVDQGVEGFGFRLSIGNSGQSENYKLNRNKMNSSLINK